MKKARSRNITPLKHRITYSRYSYLLKNLRKITEGVIHIQSSMHNTIISVADSRGQVVFWDSAGTSRFKGPKRGTPYAAQIATKNALHLLVKRGMKRGAIIIKGFGPGRDAALKTAAHSGFKLNFIRDVTPLPHNGCRPPKRRRLKRKNHWEREREKKEDS